MTAIARKRISSSGSASYAGDRHAWAREQAALLRAGLDRVFPKQCPYRFDEILNRPIEWPDHSN